MANVVLPCWSWFSSDVAGKHAHDNVHADRRRGCCSGMHLALGLGRDAQGVMEQERVVRRWCMSDDSSDCTTSGRVCLGPVRRNPASARCAGGTGDQGSGCRWLGPTCRPGHAGGPDGARGRPEHQHLDLGTPLACCRAPKAPQPAPAPTAPAPTTPAPPPRGPRTAYKWEGLA